MNFMRALIVNTLLITFVASIINVAHKSGSKNRNDLAGAGKAKLIMVSIFIIIVITLKLMY